MLDWQMIRRAILMSAVVAWVGVSGVQAAVPKESARLERAKSLIADEQWVRAIEQLKAAADDKKEPNRDEALFWLAHSQNQAKDTGAALDTINRLEREYPKSLWVSPARSLKIEIAQRLRRSDFLWWTAVPPPPPTPVAPTPPTTAPPSVPPTPATAPRARIPPTPPPSPPSVAVPPPARVADAPTQPPVPPAAWVPEIYFPNTDQRILALGSLLKTDARAIPYLKSIALESDNPGDARRALFVLAQSERPEARSTVIEVAKTGPGPVRVAAVRELGHLKGPAVANDLLQVYFTGDSAVRYQVVSSLGQHDAAMALMRIAESETDRAMRNMAIATLGDAGGLVQLRSLYSKASAVDAKRPIIVGFFNAQAEAELIRIAETDRDPDVRKEALARLRLLGTPAARAYLDGLKQKAGVSK